MNNIENYNAVLKIYSFVFLFIKKYRFILRQGIFYEGALFFCN